METSLPVDARIASTPSGQENDEMVSSTFCVPVCYACQPVNLIELRVYIATGIALDSNTITLASFFNLPQLIEVIAVTRFMALCLERTKIVISLRNSAHINLCLVSV